MKSNQTIYLFICLIIYFPIYESIYFANYLTNYLMNYQTNYLTNYQYSSNSCSDPLNCYLNSIVIDIPDICITESNFPFCLFNMHCYGINIDSLPSTYIYPTSLSIGIDNLGTNCSGSYSYLRKVESFKAIISETNILLDLTINKQTIYPTNISISYCNVTDDVYVYLSSDPSDNSIAKLEGLISLAINQLVCGSLVSYIKTNVSNSLTYTLDPKLSEFISNYSIDSEIPSNYLTSEYISWKSSPLYKLREIVDVFFEEILNNLPVDLPTCLSDNLNRKSSSQSTSQSTDYIINDILIDNLINQLTNNTGQFTIDLTSYNLIIQLSNYSSIYLTTLSISGLNSFTNLTLLSPLDYPPIQLVSHIDLSLLDVKLGFDLTTESNSYIYSEEIYLNIKLTNSYLTIYLSIASNKTLIDSFTIDQINYLPCLLSSVDYLTINGLHLSTNVSIIEIIQVVGSSGILEQSLVQLINNVFLLIDTGFNQLVNEMIDSLFNGPIRLTINNYLSNWLTNYQSNYVCFVEEFHYVSWYNSSVVRVIDQVVNSLIGPSGLNHLVSCLTNNTNAVTIDLSDHLSIYLANLNSFYLLDVLLPNQIKTYELANFLGVGSCIDSQFDCNPLIITINLSKDSNNKIDSLSTNYLTTELTSEATNYLSYGQTSESTKYLSITLSNLYIYLNIWFLTTRSQTTWGQIDNDGFACLANDVKTLMIDQLNASITECILSTNDKTVDISSEVNNLLSNHLTSRLVKSVNNKINESIDSYIDICYNQTNISDDDDVYIPSTLDTSLVSFFNLPIYLITIFFIIWLTVLLLISYLVYKIYLHSRRINYYRSINRLDIVDKLAIKWNWNETLIGCKELSLTTRLVIPLAILLNIGCFIWSNSSSTVASVFVVITVGDQIEIAPDALFSFSLVGTVNDMWHARVYPLALLIALFSATWPYLKLLLMLFAWIAPITYLPVHRRDVLLRFLDAFGKWSVLDFYVMLLMMCSFHFVIDIAGLIRVESLVKPFWGFYSFLIATTMSLILGHIVMAYHRYATNDLPTYPTNKSNMKPTSYLSKNLYNSLTNYLFYEDVDRESLSSHVYLLTNQITIKRLIDNQIVKQLDKQLLTQIDRRAENTLDSDIDKTIYPNQLSIQLTYLSMCILAISLFISFCMVLAGSFEQTFEFDFKGLTGLLLGDDSDVSYSLVSVGLLFPASANEPNNYALYWMQYTYFVLALAMPLGLIIITSILWFIPLSLPTQANIFILSEVFNAWAALDVFCLSIIATMLQIQQFALFIVGDSCDKINQILEKYLDSILDGYDTCFDVIATIGKNSYLLFVAAGIVFVVGSISLSVCHVVLQDRKQLIVINDNKHIDDKENNINEPLVNPIDITTTSEQNQIVSESDCETNKDIDKVVYISISLSRRLGNELLYWIIRLSTTFCLITIQIESKIVRLVDSKRAYEVVNTIDT